MTNYRHRTIVLHRLFAVGMWVKGIDGVLEIIGGFLLLLLSPVALNRLVIILTQHELVEDPHDRIATALRVAVAQLSTNTQLFGSVYLIAHGLIKIGVVVGVLRGHRWAYPAALAFLGLFIAYQLYRLSYDYTSGLLLLTVFDMVMVGLTWREYTINVRHSGGGSMQGQT
jgi:uncharacterized membrane protein